MGNTNSTFIKYDQRVIFYGNIPQRIITNIEQNREISRIDNDYFFLKKYKWHMYLGLNNQRIRTVNNIEYIINKKPPSTINPPIVYKKNVLLCFVSSNEAMNLLQHYQQEFFINNNIEDDLPYIIFNRLSSEQNFIDNWDIDILFNEEKEIINIYAVNQNLQIYQTDYYYEDFLKCRIFRNYDSLRDIYDILRQKIENNEYIININHNTQKLEIYFKINPRPNNRGNLIDFNNELNGSSSTNDSEIIKYKKNNKKILTPIGSLNKYIKLKSNPKSNSKVIADDYDVMLIVEQNVFLHVSILDLYENDDNRSVYNALLDASNYYNYLPLVLDENKICYNGFNIMLVGESQSGKSLLMNKIAGYNITRSAQGIFRTENLFMREILNGKINLYDTCGASSNNTPGIIYNKLKLKINKLNENGEKIDLLLIVIKRSEVPSEDIFNELIIKLIQLNLNYIIVINYHDRVINSIRNLIRDSFLRYGYQVNDSDIVDVNILKDITPLYRKIFEKFANNRITSLTFQNQDLSNINNLSRYSQNNHLILYKDISFDNIYKRKNWEAEKLYTKNLSAIIGTNFIPFVSIIIPLILTLKLISDLNNIYLGFPLFNSNFFNILRGYRNLNDGQRTNLLRALSIKTGLKFFLKLGVSIGIKVTIKLSSAFLVVFPLVGFLFEGIIGNLLDIPTFINDYRTIKEEYMQKLQTRTRTTLKKIVRDYNDAINYFGKRADIDINQHDYEIPIEQVINNFRNDELIELLNFNH